MISNIVKNIVNNIVSPIRVPVYRFTIKTTAPNETFAPPFEITGTYDCNINWGDGSNSDITVWNHADATHSYATPGTHEIAITGTVIGWRFNNGGDCAKYYETKSWGPFNPGNNNGAFCGCSNHTITATDVPDLTGVTTLENDFRGNTALTNIPSIASWDFTNIVNATNCFEGVTLTVANFNALILSWSAQALSGAYAFHGGNSKYTTGGAVLAAWEAWAAKGWTLQSGGENLGSELFTTNPSFETGGTGGDFNGGAEADDGTSDTFTDWVSGNVNDGNGDKVEATATNHDGTYAVKMTKTLVEHVRVRSSIGGITVTPGVTYKLQLYTRGDGVAGGAYGIYDRTNGAYIVAVTPTSITAAVYAPFVDFFVAPAGCVGVDLTLRLYSIGVAYFDAVSVKAVL